MIDTLPKPYPKKMAQQLVQQVEFKGGTQILTDEDLKRERELQELTQQKQRFELELAKVKLDMDLKKATAMRVFTFLGIETLLVLIIVSFQGFRPLGFDLRDTTLNIFVTATIIQISTMAVIITRHLFPTTEINSK